MLACMQAVENSATQAQVDYFAVTHLDTALHLLSSQNLLSYSASCSTISVDFSPQVSQQTAQFVIVIDLAMHLNLHVPGKVSQKRLKLIS